ncbi:hypothetical protein ABZS71_02260 [Streptomyces sp. NPDC005393]|uniref:hypothetical protein n=1 Tax=Streptomyces sp. NPDC005393 TaxID=3157041 RepID=UPI0033A8C79C
MTKATRRRPRTPWALALDIGGWQAWEHLRPTDYHEHNSGAEGAFPTPLGRGVPAAPDRVVRKQIRDTAAIFGGLSFHEADDDEMGNSRGLVARDLRTGKPTVIRRRHCGSQAAKCWHPEAASSRLSTRRAASGRGRPTSRRTAGRPARSASP